VSRELVSHSSVVNTQTLESELKTVRENEMADIRQTISAVLEAAGHGGAVELAATSARLETKFNDVRNQIVDNGNKFRQGGENLNFHRGTICSASDYKRELIVLRILPHGVCTCCNTIQVQLFRSTRIRICTAVD